MRAVKEAKGGGHTGAMTGAMVGTAIVFFPAAPLFLFMHGKDITIPKGTEVTAYVNGDIPLDPAKYQPQVAASPGAGAGVAQGLNSGDPMLSSVDVKSSPDGADITVDTKYVGSTPSTLKLTAGDHKIRLEKSGFKVWERTLTVSSGSSATISATLSRSEDMPQRRGRNEPCYCGTNVLGDALLLNLFSRNRKISSIRR